MSSPLGQIARLALGSLARQVLREDGQVPDLEVLQTLDLPAFDSRDSFAMLRASMRAATGEERRLVDVGEQLGLQPLEILVVSVALAVERSLDLGRCFAYLQQPISASRPTIGLLELILAAWTKEDAAPPVDAILDGAALETGLLCQGPLDAPIPERWLRVAEPIVLCLRGMPARWSGSVVAGATTEMPLGPTIEAEADSKAQGLEAGMGSTLVVRGPSKRERRAVASRIASSLGRRAVFLEPDSARPGLVPLLYLENWLPVFEPNLGPGETFKVPALARYAGPYVVALGVDGGVETAWGSPLSWKVPLPPINERMDLWDEALGGSHLSEQLSSAHLQGGGRIEELGRLARQVAAAEGRSMVEMADVVEAAQSSDASGLAAHAEPVLARITDDTLVASPELIDELSHVVERCRTREVLIHELGNAAKARYGRGVRCLMVGMSGTGKTLAASWLADRLGLPLYRVDMAAVVSKYIGETEKNLSQLFSKAEHAEVILLFDEADAMFGKRTDVKTSNDRYANHQTNYLLQRFESFDGIAVLTSNSRSRFDDAFTRRLDFVIEFPKPSPAQRRRLWHAHLGEGHALSTAQINSLAAAVDLTGGHVRNVVLASAARARCRSRQVTWEDIIVALGIEYKKLSKTPPTLQRDPLRDGVVKPCDVN